MVETKNIQAESEDEIDQGEVVGYTPSHGTSPGFYKVVIGE